jgi:hypothetical protein
MPDDHRRFLITFEQGEPDWPLLGLDHVPELPAIRWRQLNLDKLDQTARTKLVNDLNPHFPYGAPFSAMLRRDNLAVATG